MKTAVWSRCIFLAVAGQLVLAGCATPSRFPAVPNAQVSQASTGLGQVRYLVTRETETFAVEARSALQKEQLWLASQGHSGPLPPAHFLAISGGGDNGAYGAGYLNGWTAAGNRPEFKVVTGISTGALTAPFAFLGPRYDPVLERLFTSISQKDIFKRRGIVKGILGDAMADSRPLASLVASYVNRQLLDEIGAEYAKGRILLVGTTNLDSLEPAVWNMTAIAASKDPKAVALFRSILMASAAIPGAFPPVMLDVDVNGTRHQEMHVDGGTIAQVFLYPPSISATTSGILPRERHLYIIRNARLDAEWENVPRRTLQIATRAIATLTRTQGIGDLYRIYTIANRDGVEFNLTFIPSNFDAAHREEFDTNYMKQLFATGRSLGKSGGAWRKYPPGFEAATPAQAPPGNR